MIAELTHKQMLRRTGAMLRAIVLAAIMGAGSFAAAGDARAQAPTKLDFGGSVTWLGQVPILAALEKGFFKEEGLEVEFKTILTSYDRIAALTAGSIAFSNLGRVAVISEMARGNRSFYYFAQVDDSPGSEGCWARPGIASVKELKGKKIAGNSSAEITFHGLLRANDMTIRDVTYLNLPPNEMAGALSKGDVDAACVWQPLLGGLEKAVPTGKLLGTDKDTDIYAKFKTMASPDIMIISRKLVDEHPEQARKLARAVLKGADFVISNPQESANLVAKYFRQEPAEFLQRMKTFDYFGTKGWQEHMKLHTEQMQYLADWLQTAGKIPVRPDVRRWENTSFVDK
jgi:NitT/TauT family transport system substrate-binding protein